MPRTPEAVETTGLLTDASRQAHEYGAIESPTREAGATHNHQSEPSKASKQVKYIFSGLALPIFLGTFDRYIVNTNYVQIATELNSLGLASWISTSFFLAVACAQPLWGKLSDIFGRKACLMTSYVLFAIGGLGCATSVSMLMFVTSRVIQGLGAGGTSILTTITLNDLVSDRDRGTWQGYVNLLTSAGSSLGAPLGGIFAEQIGWRWAFYMQAPLIALSLINVYVLLRLPRADDRPPWQEQLRRLDILGAILLTGTIFCLLFGIDRGSQVSFTEIESWMPLTISPILLALLLWNESLRLKADREGFLPPLSTMNRSVWSVYAVNLFSYGAFTGIQFWIPLFYQAYDGVGPTQTGIRMLPATIATVAGNLAGGMILKKKGLYWGLIVIGNLATVASMAVIVLGTVFVEYDILMISIGLACTCFSFGMGLAGALLALICNIDRTHQATLTACMFTLRSLGSASAVSLSGTAIQAYFQDILKARLL